ncbi:MAG: IS1595 family transposase [Acidimicrobiia bacterium]
MSENPLPKTLVEAVRYFSDPEVCVEFVANLRWPNGPTCPACGCQEYSYLTTRRLWKCKAKDCRKQYSVKVGTIFEDSAIPLDKWLCSIWLIANAKNGISSYELHRAVGISQKSAWFVLHRIRLAMQIGSFDRFGSGEVEVDETFVGGKSEFMHADVRARKIQGRRGGQSGKTVVAGALRRSDNGEPSKVRAKVVPDNKAATLRAHVREQVEPGTTLYTDKHPAYVALADEFDHAAIDHIATYVEGRVHTNGIENFWALLWLEGHLRLRRPRALVPLRG